MPSVSSEPTVGIVVLNWNGAEDTLTCLASLRRSTVPVYAIVVDNGSTDDSLVRIRASTLADTIIENGKNLGYAEGNNVGLRYALARALPFVAVLNNDTLVAPNAVEVLLEHLPEGEHRAVSPDVRYFDRPDESWFAGGVIDGGWTRHLQADELPDDDGPLRSSEWLSGCCIAARGETWQRVGLFDPAYFLIFEDSDWSLRAVRGRVGLYVVLGSTIRHKVSQTFAATPYLSVLRGYYFVRNGLRFQAKYFPRCAPRFAFGWLVRPAPRLLRSGCRAELGFRWLGALAFATGRSGRVPRVLERFAGRIVA